MLPAKQKRLRRNADQGLELVQRWRASGLSELEFCAANSVSKAVLRHWIHLHEGQPAKPKMPTDFFVVTAEAQRRNQSSALASQDASKAIIIVVPSNALSAVLREVLS